MSPQAKSTLWFLCTLAGLVGATVGVASLLVVKMKLGPTAASFCAAALVALALCLYGAAYQEWARAFWGAPFRVGDRVRIVRGPGAGAVATVVDLGQGVEVEVEFEEQGTRHRRRILWGGLRRIAPARPDRLQEPGSLDARNREG